MLALLPTLLLLAPAAEAYFILRHQPLVQTRLDPIISPGQISQHEHTIVGGSMFSQNYDYETSLSSECTTAPVNIDMSNYWVPSLYYYEPTNKTFESIPAGNVNTYYLQRPGSKNEKIVAPPAGLRMVAGNPYRRTFNASNFEDQAVSFVCLDFSGTDHSGDASWDQRYNFFEHNCPDGMRAQVFFPQCWDGKSLYNEDGSHMAYPIDTQQGGNCPSTHPVHIVGIFYEFIYNVGDFPFNDGDVTWVLANGDTTGYGFHGDFTMGWPTEGETGNVLQDALDTCGLETGGDVSNCAAFAPYLDTSGGCKPQMPIVNEDDGLGTPISKLPGNNPLWIGNGTKPSDPDYDTTSPGFKAVKAVLPEGWNRTGCIADAKSGRALSAASYASDDMTLATCATFCGGLSLPYAGVEYGRECYCGIETTGNGATGELIDDKTRCNMGCAGLETDTCGGSGTLSLMTNPALIFDEAAFAASLPADWIVGPCVTDSTSSRTLKGGYWADTVNMTNLGCVDFCAGKGYSYAGTVYSQECYCSNELTSTATIADEDSCSMPCKGDIRTTCGGSGFMSLFTNATTATTASFTIVDGQVQLV